MLSVSPPSRLDPPLLTGLVVLRMDMRLATALHLAAAALLLDIAVLRTTIAKEATAYQAIVLLIPRQSPKTEDVAHPTTEPLVQVPVLAIAVRYTDFAAAAVITVVLDIVILDPVTRTQAVHRRMGLVDQTLRVTRLVLEHNLAPVVRSMDIVVTELIIAQHPIVTLVHVPNRLFFCLFPI